ncbi:GNAT family N-acetyltransferase [Patulibacter sp.]|uniref:GNAT family N-acetyltransferase n=1 Tax=Patulibacter sp. TaxID=1912859 RepID=UPI00271E3167|nr:GNAT family N-acetyltransferase [Patulibacter sp.]MDO9408588.1 GNAT family N-acetyltransferase [Patulibacter sp.]
MRFLIDTNVLISSEPGRTQDVEAGTELAVMLARVASGSHQLLLHPTIEEEIANDSDTDRRQLRMLLRGRYPELEDAPAVPNDVIATLGSPGLRSHDWYDHQLLGCVVADAVHGLITQDTKIHRKAQRLNVSDRVHTVTDAIAMLERLVAQPVLFVPSVDDRPMHAVDLKSPFFDSLRVDYAGFDAWFRECARSGRRALIVNAENGQLAGICILKGLDEAIGVGSRPGKISTFKVADEFKGSRYGELLLKTVFRAAHLSHDVLWLTVFRRHEPLIALLETFGFEHHADDPSGERRYVKRLEPSAQDRATLDPLDFHVKFGPPNVLVQDGRVFLVPIRPEFHTTLFPDAPGQQQTLSGPRAHGNALRKAYLCRANVRTARPGDTLLFYRSRDEQGLTAVGVLEQTMVSTDAEAIQQFVGSRTVYSEDEVRSMTADGPVLAMLFRQDRFLAPFRSIRELRQNGVVKGQPQTVVHVRPEGMSWVKQVLSG